MPGCGRFVRRDDEFCGRHQPHGPPEAIADAVLDGATDRADRFRARMAGRSYRDLIDPDVRAVLDDAAGQPGLRDEIGALRLALAKLVALEDDPVRMATSIARVAAVAIQAMRVQQVLADPAADGLAAVLERVLAGTAPPHVQQSALSTGRDVDNADVDIAMEGDANDGDRDDDGTAEG